MNVLVALAAVGGLFMVGWIGSAVGMEWLFGLVIPGVALALFVGGLIHRVLSWANAPVPFRIPTTWSARTQLPSAASRYRWPRACLVAPLSDTSSRRVSAASRTRRPVLS